MIHGVHGAFLASVHRALFPGDRVLCAVTLCFLVQWLPAILLFLCQTIPLS